MSFILNIDTSAETASVSLAQNGIELHTISNANQKDHAGFLHNAINDIIQKCSLKLSSVAAIAVTSGPGSYTGLRVGMATAKGLCYALSKPLVSVGTLDVMANAVIAGTNGQFDLYCPLIDARRMEVFTALFDSGMNTVSAPAALILNENSFEEELKTASICFFGSGAPKFEAILTDGKAVFISIQKLSASLCKLSFERFLKKNFTHLVDSEPLYIKEFQSSPDLHNKK